MTDKPRVLVVDDEEDVRSLVCTLVEDDGMVAVGAVDGQDALRRIFEMRPNLVVLDLAMPGLDGIEVLKRIRDMSDVPVLMLTATAAQLAKVRGLDAGADDYVTKPFGGSELMARVRALLRRAGPSADTAQKVIADSVVTIDFSQASVTVADRDVAVTPREFSLIAAFVRHPHQVLGPDQLSELAWGEAAVTRDQVKVYVGHLRRKIREAAGVEPIETVRGFGYRYRPVARKPV
jgi:DNA-binding response OmpR family regulator